MKGLQRVGETFGKIDSQQVSERPKTTQMLRQVKSRGTIHAQQPMTSYKSKREDNSMNQTALDKFKILG